MSPLHSDSSGVRYQINDKDLPRTARLRRGKKAERFRKPPQSIGEALLFDDPELRDVNREDSMAFLELSEEGYSEASPCN